MFAHYLSPHRERLIALLQSPEWQEVLSSVDLERWRAETLAPPSLPSQLSGAAQFLLQRNGERAKALWENGVKDPEQLLMTLSDWTAALADDFPFPILFLGLVLTLECSFDPVRCLYCNQTFLPCQMTLEDWKRVIEEVAKPVPPYIYLTGGEPLLLREQVWGEEGLVAFATRLGCAVNINTNGELITPMVALRLVKEGLARVHISLDSDDPQVQGHLFRSPDRLAKVLQGIFNLQIARELLGVRHPQIHINCVLTNLTLQSFPSLLHLLLSLRPVFPNDLLSGDFGFHLIPVGGSENAPLRPTAEEWWRFYTQTWAEAEEIWKAYQADLGIPTAERKSLSEWVPFANPFLRVAHRDGLEAYCERAAQGIYWQDALTSRCYVAPTQAFILPDGAQHWCGAHAIRRPPPLGNVKERGVRDNIRENLSRWQQLPNEFCTNCAGATCAINQSVERILREWLKQQLTNFGETP